MSIKPKGNKLMEQRMDVYDTGQISSQVTGKNWVLPGCCFLHNQRKPTLGSRWRDRPKPWLRKNRVYFSHYIV